MDAPSQGWICNWKTQLMVVKKRLHTDNYVILHSTCATFAVYAQWELLKTAVKSGPWHSDCFGSANSTMVVLWHKKCHNVLFVEHMYVAITNLMIFAARMYNYQKAIRLSKKQAWEPHAQSIVTASSAASSNYFNGFQQSTITENSGECICCTILRLPRHTRL